MGFLYIRYYSSSLIILSFKEPMEHILKKVSNSDIPLFRILCMSSCMKTFNGCNMILSILGDDFKVKKLNEPMLMQILKF